MHHVSRNGKVAVQSRKRRFMPESSWISATKEGTTHETSHSTDGSSKRGFEEKLMPLQALSDCG